MLFTVGLGSADDSNTALLIDLTQSTRGAWVYAENPAGLEKELADKLSACQKIPVENARLTVRPLLEDAVVKSICRIRPDFTPMDVSGTIRVGTLRADVPTDFLLAVTIPPKRFDQRPGVFRAVHVTLEGGGINVSQEIPIEYTVSFSRAQQIDSLVNQDRLTWEINTYAEALNRTTDPNRTGELLTNLAATAQKAGQSKLAAQASQQLAELNASGKLSSQSRSQTLAQSRAAGEGS